MTLPSRLCRAPQRWPRTAPTAVPARPAKANPCARASSAAEPAAAASVPATRARTTAPTTTAWGTRTQSCRSIAAATVDGAVTRLLLTSLTSEQITLVRDAAEEVTQRHTRAHRAAQLAVERARYEADRAERAFHQVEPENRLVARTLESRWESKLAALGEAEEALVATPSGPPAPARPRRTRATRHRPAPPLGQPGHPSPRPQGGRCALPRPPPRTSARCDRRRAHSRSVSERSCKSVT